MPWKPKLPGMSPARAFATVFMAVFLFIFLGSALVTYLMPETFMAMALVNTGGKAGTAVFESADLLARVAQRLDLPQSFAARYGETKPLDMDRVLNLLRRSVQIRQSGPPDVIEIRVYGNSPKECAELANAIANTGVEEIRSKTSQAGILELAVPSPKPARPNVALNLVLGAIVGAFLGTMAGGVGAKLAVGFDGKRPPGASPA